MDPIETGLYRRVSGVGPGVVLAHGFAGSARNFRGQVPVLRADHRVLTYDARGHARSPAPRDPADYSMKILVSDLAYLIEAEGMREPLVVGGLSMGAAVALHFALAYPERVRALVLVSYPAGAHEPNSLSARAESFAREIESHGLEAAGQRFVWGPESGLSPEMAEHVRPGFLEHTAHGLVGILRGVIARDVAPERMAPQLATLELPVLLVAGERDAGSRQATEILAQASPAARKRVVAEAGHVVNLSQPEAFNEALMDFLVRLPGSRGLSSAG